MLQDHDNIMERERVAVMNQTGHHTLFTVQYILLCIIMIQLNLRVVKEK